MMLCWYYVFDEVGYVDFVLVFEGCGDCFFVC